MKFAYRNSNQAALRVFGGIALGFAIASALFPPLRAFENNSMLVTISLAIWIFTAALDMRPALVKVTRSRMVVVSMLFLIAGLSLLTNNIVLLNRYIGVISIFFAYQIFCVYRDSDRLKDLRIVLIATSALAAVTLFRTYMELMTNSWVVRSIKSGGETSRSLKASCVGGYEFVYFMLIIGIVAFAICIKPRFKNKVRLAALVVSIAAFAFLLKANYVTAVVLYLFGVILCAVFAIAKSNVELRCSRWILLVLFLGLSAVCIGALFGVFDDFQGINLGHGRLGRLFSEGISLETLSEEFLSDRYPKLLISWNTLINNPLFGAALGVSGSGSGSSIISQAGQHSFILDSYAYFGLLIGTLVFLSVLLPLMEMRESGMPAVDVAAVGITILVLLFINNVTPSIAYASFIYFPFLYHDVSLVNPAEDQAKSDLKIMNLDRPKHAFSR